MKWKQEHYKMTEAKQVTLQEIVDILSDGVHSVEFEKLDGTWRMIQATLDTEFTGNPEVEQLDASKIKALAVFEPELNEWRSFRLDRMIAIDTKPLTYAGK